MLLKVLFITIHLNCNADPDAKFTEKWLVQVFVPEICPPAKGITDVMVIRIAATRHVESIIMMTNSGLKGK